MCSLKMQYPVVQDLRTWINRDAILQELHQLESLRYEDVTFPKYSALFNLRDVSEPYMNVSIDELKKAFIYRMVQVLPLLHAEQRASQGSTTTAFESFISILTLSRYEILESIKDQGEVNSQSILCLLHEIIDKTDTDPDYIKYLQPIVDTIQYHLKQLDLSNPSLIAHGVNKLSNADVEDLILDLIELYYREDLIDEITHSHESRNLIVKDNISIIEEKSPAKVSSSILNYFGF